MKRKLAVVAAAALVVVALAGCDRQFPADGSRALAKFTLTCLNAGGTVVFEERGDSSGDSDATCEFKYPNTPKDH